MNERPTRRTIGKLLIASPVALSLAELACVSAPKPAPEERPPGTGAAPASPPLTPKERKDLDKAVAQLRKTLAALHKASVPMGAEPAFVFAPLLPAPRPPAAAPRSSRRRKT